MDLSVIIVSWNIREKLRDNLISIYGQTQHSPLHAKEGRHLDFEVFVVDNNSSDDTVQMVKTEFPQVKLVANRENFGFARANNQAINLAQGNFILLLNPDMRVFADTFINMVGWMRENPSCWVAGCHLLDEQGKTVKHVRNFPTIWDQIAIILKLPHLFPALLNKYLRDNFDYNEQSAVDSVRGGFFMIRRGTINKIGLLDEQYFLWFEEVDYCRRVRQAGGEVWYTPEARCIDYVGQSFKQIKRGTAQGYFRDSMLKYFRKWHTRPEYWLIRSVWPIGISLALIGEKLKTKTKANT